MVYTAFKSPDQQHQKLDLDQGEATDNNGLRPSPHHGEEAESKEKKK